MSYTSFYKKRKILFFSFQFRNNNSRKLTILSLHSLPSSTLNASKWRKNVWVWIKKPFCKKNFKIMMVLCVHFLPRIRCENVFYVPMKIPDYIAIFWQQVVSRKFCDKQELHKAVIRLWIEYHFLFFTVKKNIWFDFENFVLHTEF